MNFKDLTKSKKLALYALSTAIVTISTMIIKFPTIATSGYINFGDTFIFIFATIFNPLCGLICGGLGSGLADILSGYAYWAPFTIIIKGLEGLCCGLISSYFFKRNLSDTIKFLTSILSFIIASVIMVIGYMFGGAILKGSMQTGIASIPENLIQGGVSILIALIILFVFKISKRLK